MVEISEYEQERLRNIERNRELLAQFNLIEAKDALLESTNVPGSEMTKVKLPPRKGSARVTKTQKAPQIPLKQRKSSRLQGIEPPPIQIEEDGSLEVPQMEVDTKIDDELWDGKLLKPDEYFDKETCEKAIRTNGHFEGWLDPELIEKYKFEASAAEAWEKNGGGKFSYKDPLGTGKKTKGSSRFNAKAVAQMMFKKNPNMYFYRHNEPGVEQWTGDWTEEEKEKFLEVARKYGCGDKWGIFASYIPHRVGYQCSNYYRSVVLPSGLVFDSNYEYTPSGKPIYIGNRRGRSE